MKEGELKELSDKLAMFSDMAHHKYEFLLECAESIWLSCPFKDGDRVCLSKTPTIEKDSRWRGSKHFLVKGAAATICERDFYKGKFRFGLIFDDESWIGTVVHPVEPGERHQYTFGADDIEALPTKKNVT